MAGGSTNSKVIENTEVNSATKSILFGEQLNPFRERW
jgi:hypothetical protein